MCIFGMPTRVKKRKKKFPIFSFFHFPRENTLDQSVSLVELSEVRPHHHLKGSSGVCRATGSAGKNPEVMTSPSSSLLNTGYL